MNKIIVLSAVILLIIGYMCISQSKKITPQIYVSNIYLYVTLAIIISYMIILQLSKYNYILKPIHLLLAFIVCLVSIIGISNFSNNITRHLIWGVFILSISMIIYPSYQSSTEKGILNSSIIATLIIIISLSVYSFYSSYNFVSWKSYLLISLMALIILEVCDMLFNSLNEGLNKRFKIYSYIAIVLFSCFILYDTQVLKKRSLSFQNIPDSKTPTPNYPAESVSLFLDIINMFINISNVN